MTFVDVWIIYAIFGSVAFCAVFVWAVRTGQFSDLDRARYLALNAAKPYETDEPERVPRSVDRYTVLVLMLLTLGAITSAILMGIRGG